MTKNNQLSQSESECLQPDNVMQNDLVDLDGPLKPVTTPGMLGSIGSFAIELIVGSVVCSLFVAGSVVQTMGARQSTKLEWRQRQVQIDAAIASQDRQGLNTSEEDNDLEN